MQEAKTNNAKATRVVSAALSTGELAEMVMDRTSGRAVFAVGSVSSVSEAESVSLDGIRLLPYSVRNNLLTHRVLLLPSAAEEYGTAAALVARVQAFINRHVDLSTDFEAIATYYVIFSWVYDNFSELPYLRVRGDYGTGKSRFLLTIGSLCYKPIFASGASSVSPLFRMLDSIQGTLVLDEGDFRLSDERAEIVKILNNGNARGFPVLRSEVTPAGEYNPRAFAVFGPKVIATRRSFDDRALESRCITEDLGGRPLRRDIPLNIDDEFHDEATALRNQLLMFRFRNHGRSWSRDDLLGSSVEPRIRQVFGPLLSVVCDERVRERLVAWAMDLSERAVSERGLALEAELLEVVRDLRDAGNHLSLSRIATEFNVRHASEYPAPVPPRWIGGQLRRRLGIAPIKSHGTYIIPLAAFHRLDTLMERYGLADRRVDEVDAGDVAEAEEGARAASDGGLALPT